MKNFWFKNDRIDVSVILRNIKKNLAASWLSILITCEIALVFSFMLLILFRCTVKYVIWIIYFGLVSIFVISAIVVFVFYIIKVTQDDEENISPVYLLLISAVLALIAVFLGIILYCFMDRIKLMVEVYKESSKVLLDVPMILFEPLLTFTSLSLTCMMFFYFSLVIESSGFLKAQKDSSGNFVRAVYAKNIGLKIARFVNIVGYAWFTSFILSCQHFIIASTVCQWYFERSKHNLESPIQRSFLNMLKFHLGSVCYGALVITAVKVIKLIIEGFKVSESQIFYANLANNSSIFFLFKFRYHEETFEKL